jgi:hypothetical protein
MEKIEQGSWVSGQPIANYLLYKSAMRSKPMAFKYCSDVINNSVFSPENSQPQKFYADPMTRTTVWRGFYAGDSNLSSDYFQLRKQN